MPVYGQPRGKAALRGDQSERPPRGEIEVAMLDRSPDDRVNSAPGPRAPSVI